MTDQTATPRKANKVLVTLGFGNDGGYITFADIEPSARTQTREYEIPTNASRQRLNRYFIHNRQCSHLSSFRLEVWAIIDRSDPLDEDFWRH